MLHHFTETDLQLIWLKLYFWDFTLGNCYLQSTVLHGTDK